jgi:hypothetical protein
MKAAVAPGRRYRARVHLGVFEQVVSNAALAERFKAVGFSDVSVTGSGRDRWAFGAWRGAPTEPVELPEQIIAVEEIV